MRDVRRIGERGADYVGARKNIIGCFLDDLRAFGINADQWRLLQPSARGNGSK